ncbi:helix-turn-helix transcriptional regulator [Kribbella sp. CA-253562]|uniref:helix-turn-helix transcriptional regulator n=1 Tax=Kribbella sp. CA-253562 TaxID=3239942 RepID=UPI003D92D022
MQPARRAEVLRTTVREGATEAADCGQFRTAALAAIADVVPYDGACLAMVDPATMLPTTGTTLGLGHARGIRLFVDLEYGPTPDSNSYADLAHTKRGIRGIWEACDGMPEHTTHYNELVRALGMRDEVRMVFRGSDGRCWGYGSLMRAKERSFDDDDVDVLARCLRDLGDGLRGTLLRQVPVELPPVPSGPAVVIVDGHNEIEIATPQALEHLDRLQAEPNRLPDRFMPALAAVLRYRRFGARTAVSRARTADGGWIVIRAGELDGDRVKGRIVVTLEPAQPPAVVSLLAGLWGLTEREGDVLRALLAGRDRRAIARELSISAYTVADHTRSIFLKADVGSRAELVANVLFGQYLPRTGQTVGPDGWFA